MNKIIKFLVHFSRFIAPAICAILLIVAISNPTLAASVTEEAIKTPSAIMGAIATVVSGVIIIIVFLSIIFVLALGNLMDSTLIFDTGMGETLQTIWSVVRNFVNIGFIIILLIVAVMVVLGIGSEGGTGMLKKVAPKFVLALVAVNLTFFAARFILTTNDVLTAAIFTLPRVISGEQVVQLPCFPIDDPRNKKGEDCSGQIKAAIEDELSRSENIWGGIIDFEKANLAKQENWFNHTVKNLASRKNMSLVLLTSMMDIRGVITTKGLLDDKSDFAISAIGSLVVAGAVSVVFTMLTFAFIVRMVVLWVVIAVSPVVALAIVMKDVINIDVSSGSFNPMDIFIKHAFMPTMVAVPLSIGMIMIFANNRVGYGAFKIDALFTFSEASGDLFAILWWIASIIVIWFGTNAMIKKASPEFAAKITDGIHGGVNKFVGGFAKTLKYMPVIPTWAGSQSVSGILRQPELLQEHFRDVSHQKSRDLAKDTFGVGTKGAETTDAVERFSRNNDDRKTYDAVVKNSQHCKRLVEDNGSQARKNRAIFAKAIGAEIGDKKELSAKEFETIMTVKSKQSSIARLELKDVYEEMKTSAGKATKAETPEQKQKSIGQNLGIDQKEYKTYKKNEVTPLSSEVDTDSSGKDKLKHGDKNIQKVKVKVDGKVVYAVQNDDKSWSSVYNEKDLEKTISDISKEENNTEIHKSIENIPHEFASITANKDEIINELIGRLRGGKINVGEINDFQDTIRKKFGTVIETEFTNAVIAENYEKDTRGWKEKPPKV